MTEKLLMLKHSQLYDQDFCLWIDATTKLLKEGRFSELDLENLIEEIEDMGQNKKDVLESNLIIVFLHLLKWKYQPNKRSGSWKRSIREHRRRLVKAMQKSPSLKPYLRSVFAECYQYSRQEASDETGLSLEIFPLESPFDLAQVLDSDYLPD
jgi:hypothetical protein